MSERIAPPPLEYRNPLCAVCNGETRHTTSGLFICDPCGCSWDDSIVDLDGEWEDTAAEQCPATVRPYEDNAWVKDGDERKHLEYRCMRNAGHRTEENIGDPEALHANPEMTCFAKEWT